MLVIAAASSDSLLWEDSFSSLHRSMHQSFPNTPSMAGAAWCWSGRRRNRFLWARIYHQDIKVNVKINMECAAQLANMLQTIVWQPRAVLGSDLQGSVGWHRCWHVRGRSAPPSLLSVGPLVSNISSSEPRSPSCAEISRCEGRRSIHQPGCQFQSKPPLLACPGWQPTAPENFGLKCRTSCRQRSSMFRFFWQDSQRHNSGPFNQICDIAVSQGIVGNGMQFTVIEFTAVYGEHLKATRNVNTESRFLNKLEY